MRPGEITIREGHAFFTVRYDERGLFAESSESAVDSFLYARYGNTKPYTIDPTARPPLPRPLGILCRPDLDTHGHSPEALAKMLVELDVARAMPGRVHMPVALPGGFEGVWQRGLAGLRRALWEGHASDSDRFVIADGLDGSATAAGTTLEERSSTGSTLCFARSPSHRSPSKRRRQKPPADAPPRDITNERGETVGFSLGAFRIQGPASDSTLGWPTAIPANAPAVFTELPARLQVPPAFRERGFRWVRLVGQRGNVSLALVRVAPDGFTLIGEGVIDLVEVDT